MSDFPADLNGTWDVDAVHSTVGFAVKHAVVATTRGHFTSYSGGATIDTANPANSTLWFEADVNSVTTGNDQRDGHLKSGDFFKSDENPKLTYRSTDVTVKGDEIVTVGDLSVAGVTHPVTITWEFGGVVTDPYGNTKAGFEGAATINRKDWGMTFNAALEGGGLLVGDKVKLVLEIEAQKQA